MGRPIWRRLARYLEVPWARVEPDQSAPRPGNLSRLSRCPLVDKSPSLYVDTARLGRSRRTPPFCRGWIRKEVRMEICRLITRHRAGGWASGSVEHLGQGVPASRPASRSSRLVALEQPTSPIESGMESRRSDDTEQGAQDVPKRQRNDSARWESQLCSRPGRQDRGEPPCRGGWIRRDRPEWRRSDDWYPSGSGTPWIEGSRLGRAERPNLTVK